ncbi:MAG: hypothetical protein GC153_03915, partial [Alphaproteobacteria bacterium]|nr:hypothetical protein [Alphaproteobacteria bacterium]
MRWLAIALIGFALAPTLLTPIPAMVDYLNQIARMDILSRAGTPDANPFFETVWRLYPNLAMDLIAPFMAKALGPIAACRIFLAISQILILSGAMALERVVKGRIALSPLAGCLFLYSLPFSFGFMNFEFGLGAALWGLAVMLAIDKRPAIYRLIVHAAFCALLFVAHFYAFGIYGAALGYYELARIRSLRSDYRFALGRFLLLAAPAAVLLVMLFMTGGRVGEEGNIWTLRTKPLAFFHILNGYNFYVSAVCMTILVAGGVYLAKSGFLRVSRVGVFMGIGFGVL